MYEFYLNMSTDHFLVLCFFSAFLSCAAGGLADKLLLERGFGMVGNGMVLILGVFGGMGLAYDNHNPFHLTAGANIFLLASSGATLLLIACAIGKSWLQSH